MEDEIRAEIAHNMALDAQASLGPTFNPYLISLLTLTTRTMVLTQCARRQAADKKCMMLIWRLHRPCVRRQRTWLMKNKRRLIRFSNLNYHCSSTLTLFILDTMMLFFFGQPCTVFNNHVPHHIPSNLMLSRVHINLSPHTCELTRS